MINNLGIKKYKRYVWIIWLLLFCMAIASIIMGIRNSFVRNCWDFQYDSARLFLLRIDPYKESLNPIGIAESMGLTDLYGPVEANQFPSLLVFLWPYAIFSPLVANTLWTITNILATVVITYLMKQIFFESLTWEQYSWYILLMLTGTPWRNVIGNGQHTLVAFMFFVLSIWSYRKQNLIQSSLFLSFSYLKYTLTVPLAFYYIYKKEYKVLIYSVIPHVILTFFSAIWLRTSFLDLIISPLKISSKLATEGSIDIGHFLGVDGLMGVLIMIIAILVLMIYVIISRTKLVDERELWCVLIMGALICTYHRNYDFFVAVIPLVYLNQLFSDRFIKACLIYETIVFSYAYWLYFRTNSCIDLQSTYNGLEFLAGIIWYILLFAVAGNSLRKRKIYE